MNDFEQVFQGDVWIMRLPDNMNVERGIEIPTSNGKLVVQEGEMTGHHHYVDTLIRPSADVIVGKETGPFDIFTDPVLKEKFSKKRADATAKLYTAEPVARQLVADNILLRPDLVVGLLEVEHGPMNLYHQEHSSIGLLPGRYVVGRQIESVAGEERRVAD